MGHWVLPLLITLTVLAAIASLHLGLRFYTPTVVWAALAAPDGSHEALIITGLRVPRTLVALVVGAGLAVSGLLMQAVFRNPLAEPGLLGVNAGASFAVVTGFAIFGVTSLFALSLLALLGAFATMAAIFGLVLAARGALTPVSLILAGVTIAALLGAITQVLIIIDESTMEALLFWLAGGFADRDATLIWAIGPLILCMICLAAFSATTLDVLATGEANATALGVNVMRWRMIVLGLASALAAFAVVIAGPVGFLGLVASHLARQVVGVGHVQLFPVTALIGASLGVVADIGARLIVAPQEAPVTVLLALIGAPVLVVLIRRNRLVAVR